MALTATIEDGGLVSVGEAAGLVAAAASAVAAVGLVLAVSTLNRTLRAVTVTVEEVRRESVPLLAQLRRTLDKADAELARVDGVLEKAEGIGSTVDSASRLAYLAFSNPIIKLVALGTGTARAARRLARRGGR